MNPTENLLITLLDCAIHEKPLPQECAAGADWAAVLEMARSHHIDALLLDVALSLPAGMTPSGELREQWQGDAMNTAMSQGALAIQASILLGAMDEAGVKAVMLKGMALKALYPQPDLRTMSDMDLLVAPAQQAQAHEVMEALGYRVLEKEPGVDVMASPEGLRVELHERLFDKTEEGFLAKLDEQALFSVESAVREEVYFGEAWVFPPQSHLEFLILHMAKHLITTGFGLRQLADYALFLEKRGGEINFSALRAQMKALSLEGMTDALTSVCRTHLSLPAGPWDPAKDCSAQGEALLSDILDAGVFGKSSKERTRSAAVVYRSFETADGDKGRLRRALFPSARTLKAPYLYARRHPWLLPAAWVHRFFNYALARLTGRASREEGAEGLRIADERLRLLGELGMREK